VHRLYVSIIGFVVVIDSTQKNTDFSIGEQ